MMLVENIEWKPEDEGEFLGAAPDYQVGGLQRLAGREHREIISAIGARKVGKELLVGRTEPLLARDTEIVDQLLVHVHVSAGGVFYPEAGRNAGGEAGDQVAQLDGFDGHLCPGSSEIVRDTLPHRTVTRLDHVASGNGPARTRLRKLNVHLIAGYHRCERDRSVWRARRLPIGAAGRPSESRSPNRSA